MAEDYQLIARKRVCDFFNDFRNEGVPELPIGEVYVVWFSKTLKNWKALVSTTLPDEMYYEVTYNGNDGDTYLDVYSKVMNFTISQPEPEVVANQTWMEFSENAESNAEDHDNAFEDAAVVHDLAA